MHYKNYNYYDLIIIGAGPSGLALAQCCSRLYGKRILVIDKEETIGGCHRVKRIGNMFTEHGPRIYLSTYVNLFYMLSEMNIRPFDIFTEYYYSTFSIIYKIWPSLSVNEVLALLSAYMKYLFDFNYGKDINFKQFCIDNKFSHSTIDILDRLCRFVDGATIEKYSVHKFLLVGDMPQTIYQPKEPLDTSLFRYWKIFLQKRSVDFILGRSIVHINYNKARQKIDYIVLDNHEHFFAEKIVFAIPPVSLVEFLEKQEYNIKNCFGDFNSLQKWSSQTAYIPYISITYHFKDPIIIPKINGLTIDTDYGIVVINLSDYMTNIEHAYSRVLSVAVSMTDRPSKVTQKTANQCTVNELFVEVFRQIRSSIYHKITNYDIAILNPNNYYDEKQKKWMNVDKAYFNTIATSTIPFHSNLIHNIYNVGTHNGHDYIGYTTMESAVSNAMVLACKLYPELKSRYYIRKFWRIRDIIIYISTFILVLIIVILLYKYI